MATSHYPELFYFSIEIYSRSNSCWKLWCCHMTTLDSVGLKCMDYIYFGNIHFVGWHTTCRRHNNRLINFWRINQCTSTSFKSSMYGYLLTHFCFVLFCFIRWWKTRRKNNLWEKLIFGEFGWVEKQWTNATHSKHTKPRNWFGWANIPPLKNGSTSIVCDPGKFIIIVDVIEYKFKANIGFSIKLNGKMRWNYVKMS